MDEYISSRPPEDDSGLSAGIGFRFAGQIASARISSGRGVFYNTQRQSEGGLGQIVTIDLCIDGIPKKLDVFAQGEPYLPE
jgi:hypothetical protein